ncbi:SDR family oxidoreductase [Cellulomonas sp. URHD0024]|uniref:SDR family oxidoreductase n=1 Tax=Cellulomonas sp. URHD0024 TaxID=1302620 RepID=UPI0009DC14D3
MCSSTTSPRTARERKRPTGERSTSPTRSPPPSKAGLGGLTRSLAVEVARRGVTVNAVAPGLVETDLTRELAHFESSVRRGVPMGRPASLHEVAACVRFLTSGDASYVTGQTINVDGGLAAMALSID